MRLSEFRSLSFDCYGTLIDWEAGIVAALRPWLDRNGANVAKDDILDAFGRAESAQQAATPGLLYPDILKHVHDRLADAWRLPRDADAAAAFGASVGDWPAFPDTPPALTYLKRHCKLIILSNIDRASFAVSNGKLGVAFDEILTAQDIGSYKPDRRNFEALLESLARRGLDREHHLHVAQSLFHDHVPAAAIGLTSAWIRRGHAAGGGAAIRPAETVEPRLAFETMGELADAYRTALAAGA